MVSSHVLTDQQSHTSLQPVSIFATFTAISFKSRTQLQPELRQAYSLLISGPKSAFAALNGTSVEMSAVNMYAKPCLTDQPTQSQI